MVKPFNDYEEGTLRKHSSKYHKIIEEDEEFIKKGKKHSRHYEEDDFF